MVTKGKCPWVTNGGRGGNTRDRVIPSSAHTECTDCSFMKWKCPRKRCELGVLSHFFFFFQRGELKRTGQCIWVLRTKPETQCNRLLWVTCFCSLYLSQHHWPSHFIVWRCQGNCVESIPASPTEQWVCHFEISVVCWSLPQPLPQIPLRDVYF